MKRIEELLRRAFQKQAASITPRSREWAPVAAQEASPRRWRVWVSAAAATLALAAIIGSRYWAAEEAPAVALDPLAPAPSLTASASPSPSPTISIPPVVAAPSKTPDQANSWTSPNSRWSLQYPPGWVVAQARSGTWNLTNYKPGSSEGTELSDGKIKITLTIATNDQNATTEDLLKSYCEGAGDPELTVAECKTVTLNGDTWAYARAHDNVSGGNTDIFVGVVRDGSIYQAVAIVPDGQKANAGKSNVSEIISSFAIS